jgi:hypothetical protein
MSVQGAVQRSSFADPTIGVVGDVFRSPKRYLGSGRTFTVAGVRRTPADVVAAIVEYLKNDALERGFPDITFGPCRRHDPRRDGRAWSTRAS